MKLKRIILDLDDVLNSLTLYLMKTVFHVDVDIYEYWKFPVEAGYDIIKAVSIMNDEPALSVSDFWEKVPRESWQNVPKSRECDWLIEKCAQLVGCDEVYIATSPTKDPESHAAKVIWIRENLPKWLHRQYFITPRKWLLARPDTLLIDDAQHNCTAFWDEGGKSINLPRPWNPLYYMNTEKFLLKILGDYECSVA